MYKTSPAFSFKGKYSQSHRELKPSPLTYNLQNWNPKKTPSWKIGTEKKCKLQTNYNPGPAQYQVPLPQRSNKFGIIGKENHRTNNILQTSPSPATYSPQIHSNSPSISIAKRHPQKTDGFNSPGPGSYERINYTKTQGPVIGKKERFFEQKEAKQVPGPGSYQYIRPKSAKITFGKQQKVCGKMNQKAADPGRISLSILAGQYHQKDLFIESLKSCKGYRLVGKVMKKECQQTPGPGQYNPDYKKNCDSTPSYSMLGKYKPFVTEEIPSPNTYSPKHNFSSVHISFKKAQRQTPINIKGAPGPNYYQPHFHFKASPKYSLAASRAKQLMEDSPGPGAYDSDKCKIKNRPKSAKIGTSKRFQKKEEVSPGPGQYSRRQPRSTTPCYGFGSEKRMKTRLITSPGPGQYNIPSSVAYLAPYVVK